MEHQDYKVTIKVRNNNIIHYMEAKGIKSAAGLSKISGVSQAEVGRLLNMTKSPISKYGEFFESVKKISEALGVIPDILFNEQQLLDPLEKNISEIEMSSENILELMSHTAQKEYCIDEEINEQERIGGVNLLISTLTQREQKLINLRFGLDGNDEHTLKACGEALGVSSERVRQMEAKALRKLRQSSRSRLIIENIEF